MLPLFGIRSGRRPRDNVTRRSATIVTVPNLVFSLCAALACLIVAILAGVKGAPVVALVWGLLTIGFLGRAAYGYGRMRKD